ncbi:hypothetical protein [Streptomyces sp. NPDC093707]|uniref:hypothetical protein n=1 Tax=Streptomyces sp. NPDC093707 TaxID=3154984 RepID=UPI00344FA0D4
MTNHIAGLAARLAAVERRLDSITRTARLAYSSIEGGAIEVFDDSGSLRAVIGQQPDGSAGVTAVNGPPPPTPSVPLLEPILGGLSVTWNGTWEGGALTVGDLARVQVHVLRTADEEPDVRNPTATIESQSGGTIAVACPNYDPVWVRLLAVNTSGSPGRPSIAAQAAARKIVNGDVLQGTLTAREIKAGSLTADTLEANSVRAGILTAGSVTASMLSADALNGKVITGATIQTGVNGARAVLTNSLKLFDNNNRVAAEATLSGGWYKEPGFLVFDSSPGDRYFAMLSRGFIVFGKEGSDAQYMPSIDYMLAGGNVSVLRLNSGTAGPTAGSGQATMELVGSPDGGKTPPHVGVSTNLLNGQCDFKVDGVVTSRNIATGTVVIKPAAANTPTSATVTGLAVAGTSHRAFVSALTTTPGATAAANGVTGVSVSSVNSSGLTIWVTRQNTTSVTVQWMVVGS